MIILATMLACGGASLSDGTAKISVGGESFTFKSDGGMEIDGEITFLDKDSIDGLYLQLSPSLSYLGGDASLAIDGEVTSLAGKVEITELEKVASKHTAFRWHGRISGETADGAPIDIEFVSGANCWGYETDAGSTNVCGQGYFPEPEQMGQDRNLVLSEVAAPPAYTFIFPGAGEQPDYTCPQAIVDVHTPNLNGSYDGKKLDFGGRTIPCAKTGATRSICADTTSETVDGCTWDVAVMGHATPTISHVLTARTTGSCDVQLACQSQWSIGVE